jgi:hypothetical protein
MVATTHHGGIYLSTDRGVNWKHSSAPQTDVAWIAVTSDGTGQNLVAVATSSEIYFSRDSGATWSNSTVPVDSKHNRWSDVASDRSGRYVSAVAPHDVKDLAAQARHGVHYSSDYGQTFHRVISSGEMAVISMDRDTGSVLATVIKDSCNNLYVMTSYNRGGTWAALSTVKGAWTQVSLNAAGDRIVASQSKNGLLYYGQGEAFTPVVVPPPPVRVKYNGTMHGSKIID